MHIKKKPSTSFFIPSPIIGKFLTYCGYSSGPIRGWRMGPLRIEYTVCYTDAPGGCLIETDEVKVIVQPDSGQYLPQIAKAQKDNDQDVRRFARSVFKAIEFYQENKMIGPNQSTVTEQNKNTPH